MALAQDGKLSRKQKQLNESGVKAIIDGDYEKAIELFNQSLELGELNVTYLNLGRAYAKLGRCNDALEKYDRMAVAPRVSSPTPEELYEILTRYRSELFDECPGKVILRCTPTTLLVSIDGAEPMPCPSAAIELLPGEHTFVATLDEQRSETKAETKGMSTSYVDVELDFPQQFSSSEPPPLVHPDQGSSVMGLVGWTGVGLGAGILLAATLYDALAIAPAVDDFNAAVERSDMAAAVALQSSIDAAQTANLVFFVSGSVLLAAGATLAIIDLLQDQPSDNSLGFWTGPESTGLSFSTRF
jgi:tetratricopeptide (TPR) repeat protein